MRILKKFNKNLISYIIGIGLLLFLFVFLITCTQIGYDVNKECELAQNKYGGQCADALIGLISDESSQLGKNSAIWALGQLGDKKALSFLEQYDTGEKIPKR